VVETSQRPQKVFQSHRTCLGASSWQKDFVGETGGADFNPISLPRNGSDWRHFLLLWWKAAETADLAVIRSGFLDRDPPRLLSNSKTALPLHTITSKRPGRVSKYTEGRQRWEEKPFENPRAQRQSINTRRNTGVKCMECRERIHVDSIWCAGVAPSEKQLLHGGGMR